MSVVREVRKLRRRHVPALLAGVFALEAGWLVAIMIDERRASYVLAESSGLFTMLFPIVVGPVAVQIAGVDQQQRMGQWLTARGQSPVRRFCAKLALANVIVIAFHLLQIVVILVGGDLLGLRYTPVVAELIGPLTVATVCGCVAVTAAQLAMVELVRPPATSVVVGLLAGTIASVLPFLGLKPLGFAVPWGLLSAADPATVLTTAGVAAADVALEPDVGLSLGVAVVLAIGWSVLAVCLVHRKEQNS